MQLFIRNELFPITAQILTEQTAQILTEQTAQILTEQTAQIFTEKKLHKYLQNKLHKYLQNKLHKYLQNKLHKYVENTKATIRINIANLRKVSHTYISFALTIILPIAKLKFRYEIKVQSCTNEA